MPFFDFHLHPSLKPQMSQSPNFPSPWENIHLGFAHPDIITLLLKCSGINEVVDSQANLSQLIQGKMSLVAIALHPPESNMMADPLIKKIAAEEQTRYINITRVDAIATGNIYFQMLQQELNNLQTHLLQNGKKLKLLSNIAEYNADDADTVHAILNVEGPHAFYGNREGKQLPEILTGFWNNFEQFTSTHRIFAMNIAHLQDNDFCNHAYGIQIFNPKPFFPIRYGITQEGIDLLMKMQDKKILADIKHTSLFARQQIYGLRFHGPNWPLLCTHAGLTGIPYTERGRYFISERSIPNGFLRVMHYKPNGYLAGTSFNASSINLYDEDVKEIIRSGGMIGLSLDQRILGTPDDMMMSIDFPDEIHEEEIISPDEREFFRDVSRKRLDDEEVLKIEDIRLVDRQDNPLFHARHFMNQVLHLFNIAPGLGIDKNVLATHICIGSDFDGMINPVDCCKNVTGLQGFKDLLLENFEEWEAEAGITISSFITPQKLMDNIFYQNGLNFLKKWYV